MTLDATDAKIIRILQENGRISMQRLSEQINMSSPAATERVKKLEEAGVIMGYTALLNPEKLGLPVHALILLNGIPEARRQRVHAYVERTPEIVRTCYGMSGGLDLLLEVYCGSNNRLAEIQIGISEMVNTVTHLLTNQPGKAAPLPAAAGK